MSKEKNAAAAKAVFEKNGGIEKLFFTNDGQAFAGIEPAKTHQRELGGDLNAIHVVKNGNYSGPTLVMTESTVTPGDDTEAKAAAEAEAKAAAEAEAKAAAKAEADAKKAAEAEAKAAAKAEADAKKAEEKK